MTERGTCRSRPIARLKSAFPRWNSENLRAARALLALPREAVFPLALTRPGTKYDPHRSKRRKRVSNVITKMGISRDYTVTRRHGGGGQSCQRSHWPPPPSDAHAHTTENMEYEDLAYFEAMEHYLATTPEQRPRQQDHEDQEDQPAHLHGEARVSVVVHKSQVLQRAAASCLPSATKKDS